MSSRGAVVRTLAVALSLLGAAPASAQVATGHYVGTGGWDHVVTGVGFRPDVVVIKGDLDTGVAFTTRSMPVGTSKSISGASALETDSILSLDAAGFSLGSAWRVNKPGTDYWYAAFREVPGELAEGSYVGNGAASRVVTGLGFQPDLVLVTSEGTSHSSFWRSSAMPDGLSSFLSAAPLVTGRILRFVSDGFEVGQNAAVNASGTTHFYVAFRAGTGWMGTGTFRGNGQDGRTVGGLGFRPELVWLKADLPVDNVLRPASLQGDFSLPLAPTFKASNWIEALESDGFRVGSAAEVNGADAGVYWFAWSSGVDGGIDAGIDGGGEASTDGGADAGVLPARPQALISPAAVTVEAGQPFVLSGAGSRAAAGSSIVEWRFGLVEGPTGVRFVAGAEQRLTLEIPGRYRIRLVVVDALGGESDPAFSTVEVPGTHEVPEAKLSGCSAPPGGRSPRLLLLVSLAALALRRRVRALRAPPGRASGAGA